MTATEQETPPSLLLTIPPLDIATLTLGEMSEAERQSGRSFDGLLRGRATRKLLALFIHELRTSAQPRSWQELSDLKAYVPPS